MSIYSITFTNPEQSYTVLPYIINESLTKFVCDKKEGFITFDGVFRIDEHASLKDEVEPHRYHQWLPQQMEMHVQHREKEPYKTVIISENITELFYKTIETMHYRIEIYHRIIHECTDLYSEIDGTMNVCFTPTDLQTISFRVLETLPIQKESVEEIL